MLSSLQVAALVRTQLTSQDLQASANYICLWGMHLAGLKLVGIQPDGVGVAAARALLLRQRAVHPLPAAPPSAVQQVLVCLAAQLVRPHALWTEASHLVKT